MNASAALCLAIGLVLALDIPRARAELDLGSSTSRTPYDPYLGPLWAVLRQLDGKSDPATVAQLVRRSYGFRYSYKKDQPYVPQTPQQTEALKAGDCKAKSLWLAEKLNDRGIRFVIGKARRESAMSHAWLIWNGPNGWMILDATNFSSPLVPSRLAPNEFVPQFSYSPGGKYAHRVSTFSKQPRNGDH